MASIIIFELLKPSKDWIGEYESKSQISDNEEICFLNAIDMVENINDLCDKCNKLSDLINKLKQIFPRSKCHIDLLLNYTITVK